MSSPLATFRKHRTYWMAGLVLLAIMAFVVAPAIDFMQGAMRNDTGGNQIVVRWDGGRITLAELERMRQHQYKFVQFLSKLANEVLAAGGEPQVPEFAYSSEIKRIEDLGVSAQTDSMSVIETRLLADLAKSNGIEFDDDAADEFLVAYCDTRVSPNRLAEILREVGGGQFSEFDLRELIKLELAAMVARQMALRGWSNEFKPDVQQIVRMTQTPGDLWSDFLKLNQTAKVEAFPILVSEFTKQVADEPSEAEILAIYEQGKNQIASPIFPDPGFMREYKANFEYVAGNYSERVELEKAKITEEQIKTEYDRLVSLGQLKFDPELEKLKAAAAGAADPKAPESSTDSATPPATDTPASEKPATETPATETPATEPVTDVPATDAPATEKPATEKPATEVPEPASTTPETPAAPTSETPAPETPAETPAPAQPATEQPAAPEPKQQSSLTTVGKVRLVSTQDEPAQPAPKQEEAAATAEPASETPAAQADETGLPPVVVQPTAPTTPATEAPATLSPATEAPAQTPDAQATATTPAAPGADGETKAELRVKTLEEAREEIVQSLAQGAVIDSLQKELTAVNDQMLKYSSAFRQQAALLREGVQPDSKATRPDLRKVADVGLKHGETGMVDRSKLFTTDLGKSTMSLQDQQMGRIPMPNYAMTPNYPPFTPAQSMFLDQMAMLEQRTPDFRQYIFWKVDEQQAYVPSLAEARDEVIAYWKTQKARKLADDEAKKIAKQVGKGEQPWKDALTEAQQSLVVTTDPFTWLSGFGETPRISNIPMLDTVGEEFMKSVFSTGVGEAAAAPNNGQNIYYAYRVVEKSPTITELQERFASDPTKSAARRVAMATGRDIYSGLYETIVNRLDVQWEIPPGELTE